jgi:hypothetical protein
MTKPGYGRSTSRARGVGGSANAIAFPWIGHVHVADTVRVDLDRFVLDALGSEALEERVEPREHLFPTRLSGSAKEPRVQSMPASRSDPVTPGSVSRSACLSFDVIAVAHNGPAPGRGIIGGSRVAVEIARLPLGARARTPLPSRACSDATGRPGLSHSPAPVSAWRCRICLKERSGGSSNTHRPLRAARSAVKCRRRDAVRSHDPSTWGSGTTSPDVTRDAIEQATNAGFRHIVVRLAAPYPAGAAQRVADELIAP